MADINNTIDFPGGMDYKQNPAYDDKVMLYDPVTGKPVYTNIEDFVSAAGNNVIGSMTPSGSPSGSETNGQSYRVSNDSGADQTFANFLTNAPDGSGGFLPVVVPNSTSGVIVKNPDGWSFVPTVVDLSGVVLKTDITTSVKETTTGKVLDATTAMQFLTFAGLVKLTGKNEALQERIQPGALISDGSFNTSYTTARTVIGQPVIGGQAYHISGVTTTEALRLVFRKVDGTVTGAIMQYGAAGLTITAPADAVTVDYMVKTVSGSQDYSHLQFEKGAAATAYEPATYVITGFNDVAVRDTGAVRQSDYDANAIKVSSLTLSVGKNWFNPAWILPDTYINSTSGQMGAAIGWATILIDISTWTDETTIIFGNIVAATSPSKNYAFYDASGASLDFGGVVLNGTLLSKAISSGAKQFALAVKGPTDDVSVYTQGIICKGSDPISDYEPYSEVISAINGIPLRGGGSGKAYNQDLNTTNNVEFAGITVHGLRAFLPSGSVRPVGVEVGDAWCFDDGTDDLTIKVRGI